MEEMSRMSRSISNFNAIDDGQERNSLMKSLSESSEMIFLNASIKSFLSMLSQDVLEAELKEDISMSSICSFLSQESRSNLMERISQISQSISNFDAIGDEPTRNSLMISLGESIKSFLSILSEGMLDLEFSE